MLELALTSSENSIRHKLTAKLFREQLELRMVTAVDVGTFLLAVSVHVAVLGVHTDGADGGIGRGEGGGG